MTDANEGVVRHPGVGEDGTGCLIHWAEHRGPIKEEGDDYRNVNGEQSYLLELFIRIDERIVEQAWRELRSHDVGDRLGQARLGAMMAQLRSLSGLFKA